MAEKIRETNSFETSMLESHGNRYGIGGYPNGDIERMKNTLKTVLERNIDLCNERHICVLLKALDIEHAENEDDRIERTMIMKCALRSLLAVDKESFDKESEELGKRLFCNSVFSHRYDNGECEEDDEVYHMRSFTYKRYLNGEIDGTKYKDGVFGADMTEKRLENEKLTSKMEKGTISESGLFLLYFNDVIDKDELFREMERSNRMRGNTERADYWKEVLSSSSTKTNENENL